MNGDALPGAAPPAPPSVIDIVDMEGPLPSEDAELPVPPAIEFMADIWEKEGTVEAVDKAIEVSFCCRFFFHICFPKTHTARHSSGNLWLLSMIRFVRSESSSFGKFSIYFWFYFPFSLYHQSQPPTSR